MGRPLLDKYLTAIEMYNSGLSIDDIATAFGVTRQAMWDALKRRGVIFRPQKRFGIENTFYRNGSPTGKKIAENLMTRAIQKGLLQRKTKCEECGSQKTIEGHHDDYNKPLVVRWLCKVCHYAWHRSNKAIPLSK